MSDVFKPMWIINCIIGAVTGIVCANHPRMFRFLFTYFGIVFLFFFLQKSLEDEESERK